MNVPGIESSATEPAGSTELDKLLAEFSDLTTLLAMGEEERAGIAGLPAEMLGHLLDGSADLTPAAAARCARRLQYSLPLLRQMVRNDPALAAAPKRRNGRRRGGEGAAAPAG